MRCLRQEDVASALQLMQRAIEVVLSCTPQDDRRAFWWVALWPAGLCEIRRVASRIKCAQIIWPY